MSGTFGYELDPRRLTADERAEMRAQIAEFRKYYRVIQAGEYDRLTDACAGGLTAWQHTAADKGEALVCVVTPPVRANAPFATVYPRRLDPDAEYEVNGRERRTGAALMYGGLPVPQESEDWRAAQFHLVRV